MKNKKGLKFIPQQSGSHFFNCLVMKKNKVFRFFYNILSRIQDSAGQYKIIFALNLVHDGMQIRMAKYKIKNVL